MQVTQIAGLNIKASSTGLEVEVTNVGTEAIEAITVTWTADSAQKDKDGELHIYHRWENDLPILSPGEKQTWGPRNLKPKDIRAGATARFEVTAIAYASGRTAGPDGAKLGQRIQAKKMMRRDVAQRFLSMSPGLARDAWLKSLKDGNDLDAMVEASNYQFEILKGEDKARKLAQERAKR